MGTQTTHWIPPKIDQTGLALELASELNVNPLVAQIMINRGVSSLDYGKLYMNADLSSYGMWDANDDIDKAARLVELAIINHERIAVYGDFDADGVTSTAIMMTTLMVLSSFGANVIPYIPSRVDEGYGVNKGALDYLASQKVKLVITVDCGIRSIEEALYCKSIGMHMIITDHHNLGDYLPAADSVINPKDTRYPYHESMLAGAGVAYRFAEYLYEYLRRKGTIKKPRMDWAELQPRLLQLCSIGTVADLVPLNHIYNRAIVREGLYAYSQDPILGIKELANIANLKSPIINSTNIGFNIAPRVNAAGRLENAMIAYELLMTKDPDVALERAARLNELNIRRQELTKSSYDEAMLIVKDELEINPFLIFAASENFTPGIVGLVAGKFMNEYNCPTVIIERHGNEAHGSARSIRGIDITAALGQCSDLLLGYGGHSQAAGFTLKADRLPELKAKLQAIIEQTADINQMVATIDIDAVVDINAINERLWRDLKVLEPSGKDNSQPIFQSDMVMISKKNTMGSEGDHVKLQLAGINGLIPAVAFGWGSKIDRLNGPLSIAYKITMNSWQGTDSLQLDIQDFKI